MLVLPAFEASQTGTALAAAAGVALLSIISYAAGSCYRTARASERLPAPHEIRALCAGQSRCLHEN